MSRTHVQLRLASSLLGAVFVAVMAGSFGPLKASAQQAASAEIDLPVWAGIGNSSAGLNLACASTFRPLDGVDTTDSRALADGCRERDLRESIVAIAMMPSSGRYTARGALIGAVAGGLIGATIFHFGYECITRDAHIPCEAGYVLYFALGALPGAIVGLTIGSKIP